MSTNQLDWRTIKVVTTLVGFRYYIWNKPLSQRELCSSKLAEVYNYKGLETRKFSGLIVMTCQKLGVETEKLSSLIEELKDLDNDEREWSLSFAAKVVEEIVTILDHKGDSFIETLDVLGDLMMELQGR